MADETSQYVLRAVAPSVNAGKSVTIEDTSAAAAVDTAAVQFVISKKKPFTLFESVRIGDESVLDGGSVTYDQLQGRDAWDDGGEMEDAQADGRPA